MQIRQSPRSHRFGLSARCILAACLTLSLFSRASDHSDAPTVDAIVRQDANLTDLFAFTSQRNLVIILCVNPGIPPTASNYIWPTDVEFGIHIDTNSKVDPYDPDGLGGTIKQPKNIKDDVDIRIRFDEDGSPTLKSHKGPKHKPAVKRFFAGLRDDPFIRGPRIGRNVAAIVLELDMKDIEKGRGTLLIWGTTKVDGFKGASHDMAGRALRSMFPEGAAMNFLEPRDHEKKLGVAPDVMIYDLRRPAVFPNGRALTDDVIDLVGDPRVLGNDAPFPSENDLPFLNGFPWLAPPHPPQ